MEPAAILSVFGAQDKYLFQLVAPRESLILPRQNISPPSGIVGSTPLDAGSRSQLRMAMDAATGVLRTLYRDPGPPGQSWDSAVFESLERLGRLLFSLLLPPGLQDALRRLPDDLPLLLATDDNEMPWELLNDGTQVLALKRPVGRQFLSTTLARQNPISDRTRRSVLFITNPTDDLPQADREAEWLMEAFDTSAEIIDARFLCRAQASRLEVLEAFASSQYDVIHYSGHARPGALILADGELTAQEIQKTLRGQPFIFLNACQSAKEGAASVATSDALPYVGLSARNLASAFLLGGAIGFIGTLWPVFEGSSREFAEWFYTLILHCVPVGEALRRARERMRQERPGDPLWASFVLYGDPTIRLAGLERREIRLATVLVARLLGLSQLYEALDLETAAEIEDQVLAQLRRTAQRYGGEPRGPLTDILGVRFGIPQAQEDDAVRAIHTAVDMVGSVQALNRRLTGRIPGPLGLQVGIGSGHVLGRQIRTPEGWEYQIAGHVVDLASGLANHAQERHVLVDEATRRKTAEAFAFELLEPRLTLAEGGRPIAIYRVLGVQEEPAPTKIVGREGDITQLHSWWRQAKSKQGRLVNIVGMAGVGKTRLIQAFKEGLVGEAHQWITATCHSYDQTTSYAMLASVIRDLAGIVSDDDEMAALGKLEGLVQGTFRGTEPYTEEQLNEALALLGHVVGLRYPIPSVDSLEARLRQRLLGRLVQAVFAHLAGQQPMVVALEDLQWVDEASLVVFDQIIGALAQMRVLLIAVHRPDWVHEWARWDHYRHLHLGELGEEKRYVLLADLLGVGAPSEELARVILSRTGGNPLYIEEVVKSLRESGLLARSQNVWVLGENLADVPLPEKVENVILARIARLDVVGRTVLKTASVIGQRFEHQLLAGVWDETSRDNLDHVLSDLTRRALICTTGGWYPDLEYAFCHGLIHQATYTHLLERFRRTVHRRVAQELRRLHLGDEEGLLDRLAHHYYHSDDRVNALKYCLRAARHASEAWANETALNWYDRALEKIQSFEQLPPDDSEQEQGATFTSVLQCHVEALQGKGQIKSAMGHNDEAIACYSQALELATGSDTFPVTRQVDLYLKQAIAHHDKGELDVAQRLIDKALRMLGESKCLEAGRLHIWTGLIHYRHGLLSEGLISCKKAIGIIESNGSVRDLAQAHNLLGLIYRNMDRSDEAIAAHERSITLYQEDDYVPGLERAYSNLGCVYSDLSKWDKALQYFEQAMQLTDRTGEEWRRAAAAINLGEIYRKQGDLDRAISTYTQARETGEAFGFEEVVGMAVMNLGVSHLKKDAVLEAKTYLDNALEIFKSMETDVYLPEVLSYLAELRLIEEQPDEALELALEALSRASRLGRRIEEGRARRVLGQVYRALGQLPQADTQLTDSLVILEAQKNLYEVGLTLVEQALVRRDQVRANEEGTVLRKQVIGPCDRAIGIFRDLGASLDLELAEEVRTSLRQVLESLRD